MTLLGIDYGERRIGLAIAEADGFAARPLATVAATGDEAATLARIAAVVRQHEVAELVVGLPLEANGDHGPMAASVRAWAGRLGAAIGLPVSLRDERLTSSIAESRLGPMPRGRSGGPPSRTQRERYRARVDREAAAISATARTSLAARGSRRS
ncbi:MAG: Holliday junction resolvase RuvX [Chloroflexi bacterium]|nr:Holliday junction resolvase RuvX [Chloroflexota bacterium]